MYLTRKFPMKADSAQNRIFTSILTHPSNRASSWLTLIHLRKTTFFEMESYIIEPDNMIQRFVFHKNLISWATGRHRIESSQNLLSREAFPFLRNYQKG